MAPDKAVVKLWEATARDGDVVVDLITTMLEEMASHGGHTLDAEGRVRSRLRTRFADSLDREGHIYLLASLEGPASEVVGIVEASIVSPYDIFRQKQVVHIHSLYVEPRHRRQGLGRELLEAALRWGLGKGCAEAKLDVLAGNPARKLYERIGFDVFELEMRLEL